MLEQKDIVILTATLLPLLGLSFAVSADTYIRRQHRWVFFAICAAVGALVGQNVLEHILIVGTPNVPLRTFTAILGYSIRPLILALFMRIVSPKGNYIAAWGLVALNALINATAVFSHICFWIADNNTFQSGPLRYSCLYVSVILLVWLLYLSIRQNKPGYRKDLIIPLFVVVLILISTYLDSEASKDDMVVDFLTIAVISSCVFYYIWLHLQFVRGHEEDLKTEQRIRIMMSQIQPHFLYNTLSTIQVLCHSDPEKAAVVTGQFSSYLRQNLSSMNQPGVIPFWKELEHTKAYVAIEEIRFPNIRVQYEINGTGFYLPPLTLQPLVENAIRHGVRVRRKGLVEIITRRVGDRFEVIVHDNGAGFDVRILDDLDESHIGLRNVQNRLVTMCGGTMTIVSNEQEGTTVTISVPAPDEDPEKK